MKFSTVVFALLSMVILSADAFSSPARLPSFRSSTAVVGMARRKDETSSEYMTRLQEAASDPEKFERFVRGDDNDEEEVEEEEEPVVKKTGGYVPIEEWDANRSKDDMSWEERVQFDGQRNGNGFQQNEILRRNLNSF